MFRTIVRMGAMTSVSVLALVAHAHGANATSGYSNLYAFCGQQSCADGKGPQSALIMDKSGNLYGTTTYGGANGACADDTGCGTVFKIAPDGTETVLYNFCSQTNCADGANPWGGALTLDRHGNLYGTTRLGGNGTQNGVVFRLAPNGTETVLYSFCSQGGGNCTDGAAPLAGVIADKQGNLYGTTFEGGPANFYGGEVYKLAPNGTLTVLWAFCTVSYQGGCGDGQNPQYGNLVMDTSGNLYGTTSAGGEGAYEQGGTLYEVPAAGNEETVLYNFCTAVGCTDGAEPYAGVVMDKNGNLYGTTTLGGVYHAYGTGGGTVYEWSPATDTETVLHSFDAGEGQNPYGGVSVTANGKTQYGTTAYGGNTNCQNGCGIVFSITHRNGLYVEKVLHKFYQSEDGDAFDPQAGVLRKNGYLYGTAYSGGANSQGGVVFKLGTKGGRAR
jgi:uncharacterized repeat protein (TIGR03803 family)